MRKIKNYLVGSDVEIFLFNKKEGRIVSAVGKIGGTKEEPRKILDEGFALQEDNVLIEFNVPPVTSAGDMHMNVMRVLEYLDESLPEEYGYKIIPSAELDSDQLKTKAANTVGCDPDNSAYKEGLLNPIPCLRTGQLRCAGGHIHIGYDNPTLEDNCRIIRLADFYLGIPSLMIDTDRERRKLYGQAGNFRGKPYGVEYRSLSNFWAGSEENTNWMFNQISKVIGDFNKGLDVPSEIQEIIQDVINNGDEGLATAVIEYYDLNKEYEEA